MIDTPEITPTTDAEAAMLEMIEQLTDELAATRGELAALSNDNQRLAACVETLKAQVAEQSATTDALDDRVDRVKARPHIEWPEAPKPPGIEVVDGDSDSRWDVAGAIQMCAREDVVKIRLVVEVSVVHRVLEVPFNYASISSFGGVVVVAAGITILFDREVWREVYKLLIFGGLTSLVVDGARVFADGTGGFWLYPVWIRPVAPSRYMSADPRVLAVVLSTAAVVTGIDY